MVTSDTRASRPEGLSVSEGIDLDRDLRRRIDRDRDQASNCELDAFGESRLCEGPEESD